MLVGQPEQVVGAQARLHVLERDVVDLLAAAERMADIGQHLLGRRLDVDFGGRDAQFAHQPPGILVGFVRGAEAGHRVGQHVLAIETQQVHRPASHQQRMRRIETARHTDDGALDAARLQPLRQPLDLDVVGLVAIVAQLGRIRRHVGEPLDGALQRHALVRGIEFEREGTETRHARAFVGRAVGEGVVAQPLLADAAEVDIGLDDDRLLGEALGLGQLVATFEDSRVAVPGEIGRRLARP